MTGRRPAPLPRYAVGRADLWSWVAVGSDAGAAYAHRLARLDADGAAVLACGRRVAVAELRRVVNETARRCAGCEVVRGTVASTPGERR